MKAGAVHRLAARLDPACCLIGLLAMVLGGAFMAVNLAYNQGHLIAPLDDVYIHLQYGKQLGDGHPFEYNTGDDVSTGASSLLYMFVLGGAWAVGFTGGKFLAFAMLLGVLCFAVTASLTYLLAQELLGDRALAIWAGILVAISGPMLWGAASGMEVGLTAMLTVATVLAFVKERPAHRFVATPVLAFFLALVRPEGMILALALSAAMVWVLATRDGPRPRLRRAALPWAALCVLPLAAIIGQYTFYQVATDTLRANGVQSKSHLYDRPQFFFGDFVDRTMANVRELLSNFNGLGAHGYGDLDFAFPGALFVALAGLAYLLTVKPALRPLLIALSVALTLILLSVSTLSTALDHELRYFQPFIPLLVVLAVCGVYGLTRLVPDPRARATGLTVLLVVIGLFTAVALPSWALRLGRESSAIRDTDVSISAYLNGNLPPDAIVGVKDVGAIAYLGNRRVVDTIGLASNGFAEASNNGPGALYEELLGMSPAQRPTHFAVYDSEPGPSFQDFVDTGVFGPALLVTPVLAPPDVTGRRIVPFDEIGVYPADWSLARSGDRPPVPGDVRDHINVGALDSEDDHDYHVEMSLPGLQPNSVLHRTGDVVDSGRIVVGGEKFTAHHLRRGSPLTIAARILAAANLREVRVLVDGRDVGLWRFRSGTGGFSTQQFTVPADAIRSGSVEIELKPPHDPLFGPYPEYTSYGYWFVQ